MKNTYFCLSKQMGVFNHRDLLEISEQYFLRQVFKSDLSFCCKVSFVLLQFTSSANSSSQKSKWTRIWKKYIKDFQETCKSSYLNMFKRLIISIWLTSEIHFDTKINSETTISSFMTPIFQTPPWSLVWHQYFSNHYGALDNNNISGTTMEPCSTPIFQDPLWSLVGPQYFRIHYGAL